MRKRTRDEHSGRVLAERYALVRELGRGGMASVYSARDARLSRDVAVKLLREASDPIAEERFLREVRNVSQMDHPGISVIHDFGRDGDLLFFVMPLLRGTELRTLLARGALPEPLATDVAHQIACALHYSHERGVVHRDVKPENVMLLGDLSAPRAIMMDFGIAVGTTDPRVTDAGAIAGTPSYISVEQLEGEKVDGRTDVYALGVVLYECLAGAPPFAGASLAALFTQILNRQPESLLARVPSVTDALDELVMACLAKRREDRPASALVVAQTLEAIRAGRTARSASPTTRPPPPRPPENASDSLGDLLHLHGEYEAAKAAFDLAYAARRRSGAAPVARDEARYGLKLASLAHKVGRYDEAIERADVAIALVDRDDALLAAELEAVAALASCFAGRLAEARERVDRGFSRIEEPSDGSRRVEARLYRSLGNVLAASRDFAAAATVYERGLACCDPEIDRWERSVALFNVADAHAQAGRHADALAYLERAVDEKVAIGDRWGLSYARLVRARIELDRGDVERGLKSASAGLALANELGDPKLTAMLHAAVGRLQLARAELDDAAESFDQALDAARACGAVPEIVVALLGISDLAVARRQFMAAADAAVRASDLAARCGLDSHAEIARRAAADAARAMMKID